MCQTMEMIRIPTTIQEITRNHDRALINLERLPSGYKVRQRIYRDFQEPMLNVAHEQFGDNPMNTYSSSSGTANTSQVGTENTNLLPNPISSKEIPCSITVCDEVCVVGAGEASIRLFIWDGSVLGCWVASEKVLRDSPIFSLA
ncbi:hypothetical protein GJ496_007084 [Pomphorhynchus laevis]|nr:hypothetical protein GJ496_007084 [Pomphorhynchus laevis]